MRVFKDYFNNKIDEEILIEAGGILHHLQQGTWDYDPEIMGVTCDLDDQTYENYKIKNRNKREKLYRDLYKIISENQTISVSISNDSIKKLNIIAQNKNMIHSLIKDAIIEYLEKYEK